MLHNYTTFENLHLFLTSSYFSFLLQLAYFKPNSRHHIISFINTLISLSNIVILKKYNHRTTIIHNKISNILYQPMSSPCSYLSSCLTNIFLQSTSLDPNPNKSHIHTGMITLKFLLIYNTFPLSSLSLFTLPLSSFLLNQVISPIGFFTILIYLTD